MKLRKQLLAALFAIFTVFAVAACDTGPEADIEPADSIEDPAVDPAATPTATATATP